MKKLLKMAFSLVLCCLFGLVPCFAYASVSEMGSTDLNISSVSEDIDERLLPTCMHVGEITYIRRSPVQIDVTVTHHITDLIPIPLPCTDVMKYVLVYEIVEANGETGNPENFRTKPEGLLGRECSEVWNFGGVPGMKLRCRIVTLVHNRSETSDWVEIPFTS